MAEERSPLQNLQEQHNFEITLAFQAFAERWRSIFSQEEAKWAQAGKQWKLAQEQDGHLSWKDYDKPFAEKVQDYQQTLAGMQARVAELRGDIPARGTEAYVRWVVQGAVATGIEEGYPLRPEQVRAIEARVRTQEGLSVERQKQGVRY